MKDMRKLLLHKCPAATYWLWEKWHSHTWSTRTVVLQPNHKHKSQRIHRKETISSSYSHNKLEASNCNTSPPSSQSTETCQFSLHSTLCTLIQWSTPVNQRPTGILKWKKIRGQFWAWYKKKLHKWWITDNITLDKAYCCTSKSIMLALQCCPSGKQVQILNQGLLVYSITYLAHITRSSSPEALLFMQT